MPPFTQLRVPVVDDLARQLRFAPAEAARRAVERAEQLALELDPTTTYPAEWIVFKVTGYRPASSTAGLDALVPGEALLGDLTGLVERLSAAGNFDHAALAAEGAIDAATLCERWNVSKKTLDRYRRRGLIARRASGPSGKPKLMFTALVVRVFAERHGDDLRRAGEFSRMSPDLEARLIRRAVRYRRLVGFSLNQAAKRLSERFNRSQEAVRQLLARAARDPASGLSFDEPGPITEAQRRGAFRAWRRGLSLSDVAKRWDKAPGSVLRAVLLERAALLRGAISNGSLPSEPAGLFVRESGDDLLRAPAAMSGLGQPGITDLAQFIEVARVRMAPSLSEESTRLAAYHCLRHRAAAVIRSFDRYSPRASDTDLAETMLRWAARLKAELIRSQLALIVETLEGIQAGRLDELAGLSSSLALRDLLSTSISAAGEAIDQMDPARVARGGGRAAAAVGLAVARAATRWQRDQGGPPPSDPRRASHRLLANISWPDWTRFTATWQIWLELDPRVRPNLESIDPRLAALLTARQGWGGKAPRTIAQAAAEFGVDLTRAARMEREAVRAAINASRSGPAHLAATA